MKIKIINPNTTWAMTESIERMALRYARETTEICAVSPAKGPESIECYFDEYLAIPGVLEEVRKGERIQKQSREKRTSGDGELRRPSFLCCEHWIRLISTI